jgi:ribose transport system substrate-binding protein
MLAKQRRPPPVSDGRIQRRKAVATNVRRAFALWDSQQTLRCRSGRTDLATSGLADRQMTASRDFEGTDEMVERRVPTRTCRRSIRKVRSASLLAALAAFAVVLTACSSSGSAGGASASATSAAGGGSSGASAGSNSLVAQAKLAVAAATQGLVYSATDTPTDPSAVQPYGDWRGPSTAPAPAKGPLVEIIPCTMQAASCANTATTTAAAAKSLGWRTDIITSGALTPEQAAQAFNVALSRKPQAIIAISVNSPLAPQQIAAAEKQGIVTVEDAGDPFPTDQVKYDAYVSFRNSFEWTLNAYAVIADSNGTANVLAVDIPDAPQLHNGYEQFKAILAKCSGCTLSTLTMTVDTFNDPTTVEQDITAAVASHPGAKYLQLAASEGLPAIVAGLNQAGKANKLTVLVQDADPVGLAAVTQGSVKFDPGFSLGWLAYAGVDQVVRGLAKAPYLTTAQIGLGLHMFTAATAPASGNSDDYAGFKTYVAKYNQIWGVQG